MSGVLRVFGRIGETVLKTAAFVVPMVPHAPWWAAAGIYAVGHLLGLNLSK